MKFLADESIEYRVVIWMRKQGLDVVAIAEESPSIKDEEVLSLAVSGGRILLTNDKDFGELIFLRSLLHKGVILFRISDENAQIKINKLDLVLKQFGMELKGKFVVISDKKVRIRKTESKLI